MVEPMTGAPMTGALAAAMAPTRRVRGARPSKLHEGAVVSRVPALPTPLIARPDRWPATDRSREQLLDALASIEGRHARRNAHGACLP
jgi:hypothetical protein